MVLPSREQLAAEVKHQTAIQFARAVSKQFSTLEFFDSMFGPEIQNMISESNVRQSYS